MVMTLLALLAGSLSTTVPDRAGTLRLVHLELEVTPDFPAESLAATARLTLVNRGEDSITEVPILLNRLLAISVVRAADGGSLRFTQGLAGMEGFERMQVRSALIALGAPVAPGDTTILTVAYSGWMAPYVETGMLYVRDRVDSTFTILREDALAFPAVGLPSMASRRASRGEFTYRVSVSVPNRLTVAAGGKEVGRSVGSTTTTWTYATDRPAPFLLVCIAPYQVIRRGGARIFYLPDDSAGARAVAERTGQGLALMERWYGPLRDAPALTIMEIPDGWGSQANLVGGIIQTAAVFRDASRMSELYHELSHLWNPPDLDLPSARWNEGLATFLSRRIAAELDQGSMDEASERLLQWFKGIAERREVLQQVPFRDFGRRQLTDYSYGLGGVMFSVLYGRIGPERFDAAYRSIWRDHREGVSFEDLQRAFVREAPGMGLERFFERWVATPQWLDAVRSAESYRALVSAAGTD